MWQFTACVPEIDLERERILARFVVEHPLQWRVGDKSAVPIVFAVDFGSRKAGRQRTAGNDMLRSNASTRGVEINKVASAYVHAADAEAHASGVDPVEIHQAFERSLERG